MPGSFTATSSGLRVWNLSTHFIRGYFHIDHYGAGRRWSYLLVASKSISVFSLWWIIQSGTIFEAVICIWYLSCRSFLILATSLSTRRVMDSFSLLLVLSLESVLFCSVCGSPLPESLIPSLQTRALKAVSFASMHGAILWSPSLRRLGFGAWFLNPSWALRRARRHERKYVVSTGS